MRAGRRRRWPNALAELSAKFNADESVKIWHIDEELELTIYSITRRQSPARGRRIQLSCAGMTVIIKTTFGSDYVDIRFISKGQP